MARLNIPTIAEAPVKSQPILENYVKVLGVVPNFFTMISQSPDALKAIADMHATLGKSLGHKTRERIYVMTAEVNACSYCLTAPLAFPAIQAMERRMRARVLTSVGYVLRRGSAVGPSLATRGKWRARHDSNVWPPPSEGGALSS